MSEPKFLPYEKVGVINDAGCNACGFQHVHVVFFKELAPEIQLLLQEAQAAKERWKLLEDWVNENCALVMGQCYQKVRTKMRELESGGE